jgi:hypothetical protein
MHDDFKETEFRKNRIGYYLYTGVEKQLATFIFQNYFQTVALCIYWGYLGGEKRIKIVHISMKILTLGHL